MQGIFCAIVASGAITELRTRIFRGLFGKRLLLNKDFKKTFNGHSMDIVGALIELGDNVFDFFFCEVDVNEFADVLDDSLGQESALAKSSQVLF